MKYLKRIVNSADWLSDWSGKVVSFFILVVMATTLLEIVARYFFHNPTIWVYETNLFLFGGYFMLVGAYALLYRAHVGMDLFYGRLSPRGKAIIDSFTSILAILFCLALIWRGWEFAWESISMWEKSITFWGPPIWPFKTIIPVAATLMLIQVLANLVRDVVHSVTGNDIPRRLTQ